MVLNWPYCIIKLIILSSVNVTRWAVVIDTVTRIKHLNWQFKGRCVLSFLAVLLLLPVNTKTYLSNKWTGDIFWANIWFSSGRKQSNLFLENNLRGKKCFVTVP